VVVALMLAVVVLVHTGHEFWESLKVS